RHIDRSEPSDISFVEAQELPARRQGAVHQIEDLAVDTRRQSRERDGVGAIVDVGQRQRVRSAEMEKWTEGSQPDASGYRLLLRAPPITTAESHALPPE